MSPPKTILVPTDFSEEAEAAVRYAVELAASLQALVHLLHAYRVPVFSETGPMTMKVLEELEHGAERLLTETAERYRAKGAIGQLFVKTGDARDVIIESASALQADLIVMGTHGRRGVKRMLLGSVAEEVVRHAPCDVLVVPSRHAKPS